MNGKFGLFQVQATVNKVTTFHRCIKITFETQENLTIEQKAKLFEFYDQLGHLTFSPNPIQPQDILDLPKIVPQNGRKSPSQRLRAVLYRKWESEYPNQEISSEDYYNASMEKLITMVKNTL